MTPAVGVCPRCGSFVCAACSPPNPKLQCAKCRTHGLDVPGLAKAYRNLVLWFGLQLLVEVANSSLSGPLAKVVVACVLVATVVALTLYAYRTSRALGSKYAVLWAAAMFVPCVNALTLLVLSSNATAACRENGIEVGLFGPKL